MPVPPPVDLKPFFQTYDDVGTVLDWRTFFGNDQPVEIDVGCGRGLFVVNAATNRPDVNFLGIELDFHEARRGAKRLKRRNLTNARIIGGSVFYAFDRLIAPASVAAIHVYFPDPWWKRRHRRRRVFTDELVNHMARLLVPGGLVHSWTDVEEYFGVISALMNNDARFETLPPRARTRAGARHGLPDQLRTPQTEGGAPHLPWALAAEKRLRVGRSALARRPPSATVVPKIRPLVPHLLRKNGRRGLVRADFVRHTGQTALSRSTA